MTNLTLPKFSIITAVSTFLLLIAGALVTSTGSGLAVPDWPLSFGQFFPRMEGGVLFEHGHRMVAGAVGIMTFVLTGWLWTSEPRKWLCWLGTAASVAVLLQASLGGLTVLMKLPPQVSIAHAVLAQTFFCITVSLAYFMNRGGDKVHFHNLKNPVSAVSLSLTILLYVQLALGAALRHLGSSNALYFHASVAGLVVILNFVFLAAASRHRHKQNTVFSLSQLITGLILTQIVLGLFSIFPSVIEVNMSWFARTFIVTSHVATGALILATSLFTFLRSLENA